jgi:hypothetical protein
VTAARRKSESGGDEALRGVAQARAHAHADASARTDTAAIDARDPRFGFFLEYDRGTEKPQEYAAKLASILSLPRFQCVKARLRRLSSAVTGNA